MSSTGKIRLHRKFKLQSGNAADEFQPLEVVHNQAKEAAAFYQAKAAQTLDSDRRNTYAAQAAMYEDRVRLYESLFSTDAPTPPKLKHIKLSPRDRLNLYRTFTDGDAALTDALYFLAEAGDALAAERLANKAALLVARLLTLAQAGRQSSAEALAILAVKLVEEISPLAVAKPELFYDVAKPRHNWPVLKSRHPFLCEDEHEIFQRLKVGEVWGGLLDPSARWNPKRPACNIALNLLAHVASHKERFLKHQELKLGEIERPPAWVLGAMRLPPLSKDGLVITKWWTVAKGALEESYPDPAKVPELMALLTAKSHLDKSPASRIMQKIEEAFRDICGERRR